MVFAKRLVAALLVLGLAGCASVQLDGPTKSAPPVVDAAPVPMPTSASAAPATAAGTSVTSLTTAQDRTQQFARWVESFRNSARAAGIGEATLRAALDGVRYLPQVVQADKAQPEFSRPLWDYLDSAVSAQRVARGQDKLRQFVAVLGPIAARYGVPACWSPFGVWRVALVPTRVTFPPSTRWRHWALTDGAKNGRAAS